MSPGISAIFIFTNADVAALLIWGAIGIFLVMRLARWASGHEHSTPNDELAPLAPEESPDGEASLTGEARNAVAPAHPEMDFGPAKLEAFYFNEIDSMKGPADPECFYDELHVKAYWKDSGYTSDWSCIVGTPAGFDKVLRDNKWDTLYQTAVLVMRRYDLNMLKSAVMEQIVPADGEEETSEEAEEEAVDDSR